MNDRPDQPDKDAHRPQASPELTPPDASLSSGDKSSRRHLWWVLGCGALLFLTAVVVLLLPPSVPPPDTPEPDRAQTPPAASPPSAGQQTAADDSAAEINRLLVDWLKRLTAAEAENVAAWGGDDYTRALSLAERCDRLLGERKLLPARAACDEAIGLLDNLLASQASLLEEALDEGALALAEGAPERANMFFQRALAIEADNVRASEGVRRAASLPDVLRLIDSGLSLEREGDADAARQAYADASALDPDYAPAQEHLARIQAAIAEREYGQAMSRALQALERGELNRAKEALDRAKVHKPDDPALRDLQQQLSRARLASTLTRLRQQGEALEKSERWSEALKVCEQALALDPHAAFAASCRERVTPRIELDEKIRAILARPERLYADGPLQQARQFFALASQAKPRGPLLAGQLEQLTHLISQAEAEVEVVIRSDGLTDVVIYHVGRLGRFKEHRLTLRTGNYTATGSRLGFRDVRQTLKVRPGSGPLTVTLQCEEPI